MPPGGCEWEYYCIINKKTMRDSWFFLFSSMLNKGYVGDNRKKCYNRLSKTMKKEAIICLKKI
ncbi:hypothetical protein AwErysi_01490 [Erysipelotrichaceae bacterium]|nr:hypothetical protein AwErysi_01490 [Erysipelotrichaceae bacterium]